MWRHVTWANTVYLRFFHLPNTRRPLGSACVETLDSMTSNAQNISVEKSSLSSIILVSVSCASCSCSLCFPYVVFVSFYCFYVSCFSLLMVVDSAVCRLFAPVVCSGNSHKIAIPQPCPSISFLSRGAKQHALVPTIYQ